MSICSREEIFSSYHNIVVDLKQSFNYNIVKNGQCMLNVNTVDDQSINSYTCMYCKTTIKPDVAECKV